MVTIKLMQKIEGRKFQRPFSWLSLPDKFVKKTYRVPYISGKSLLKSDTIGRMIQDVGEGKKHNTTDAEIIECCQWFCTLFQDQFTVEELLLGHPADQLMSDIFAAYISVQNSMSGVLKKFPMKPTAKAQMR